MADTCFCCGKPLRNVRRSVKVFCDDDQAPLVGQDCAKLVKAAGRHGYQPPLGGPRVWWSKSWTPSASAPVCPRFPGAAVATCMRDNLFPECPVCGDGVTPKENERG